MKRFFGAVVLGCMAATAFAAGIPPSPAVNGDDDARRKLDEFVTRLEAFGFSGGVLVSRNGSIVLEKGYGLADRASGAPCTPETVFDIGSNTKDLTKTAILQLAAKGKLRLDDAIVKYFPDAPADKAAITIEQLLDHTAGFKLYSGDDDEACSRQEMLKRMFASDLLAPPGKAKAYSNPGYSLLAAIIEIVSGGSYEAYCREHVFIPAGMKQTGYALVRRRRGEVAHAYSGGMDRGSTLDYPHLPDGPGWNLRGNGGTLSTLGDMNRFYSALEGETLLARAWKAKLFPQNAPIVLVGGNGVHFFLYHRQPADRSAIIIASTDAAWKAMDLDRAIAPILNGRDVAPPPIVVKLPRPSLDLFAGAYRLPSGARMIVETGPDGLSVGGDGQEAIALLAGAGPDAAKRAEALNDRARAIAEAAAKGDYRPWAEALGNNGPEAVKAEDVKARQSALRDERIKRLGAFKSVRVLGTIPGPAPRAIRTTMGGEAGESRTLIEYDFERGAAYTEFIWEGGALAGIRFLWTRPGTKFLPQSSASFCSYDLGTGFTLEIAFEAETGARPKALTLRSAQGPAVARRIE